MKPFPNATDEREDIIEAASEVIDTVLIGMREFRRQMRKVRPADLSIVQFRVLAFLNRNKGASLSELADHIGLVLPSMSKTVDWLVKRGLVTRHISTIDRRRVMLELTSKGTEIFRTVRKAAEERISEKLAELSSDERIAVINGLRIMNKAFGQGNPEGHEQGVE